MKSTIETPYKISAKIKPEVKASALVSKPKIERVRKKKTVIVPEVYTPQEEAAELDKIRQYNIERFGTDDESTIAQIVAEPYKEYDPLTNAPEIHTEFYTHPHELLEQPIKPTIKKFDHEPRKRVENLQNLNPSKQERGIRGFLRRAKNFIADVIKEKESLAEQLGWHD